MVKKSDLRRYYRQIHKQLVGSGKEKRKIITYIAEDISDYLEANPQADIAQIQECFGTPEYIAAYIAKTMDDQELIRQIRIKKRILVSVVAALLAALLIWAVGVGISTIHTHDDMHGTFEDHIS